jgi:hypothetical protein
MRFHIPGAMAVALLLSGAAEAPPLSSFQPGGAATLSCGAWSAERRENKARSWMAEQWVMGFLSGIGYSSYRSGVDPLNGVDDKGVWAWVDNYCRDHPLYLLLGAAAAAFSVAHPH